MRDVDDGCSGGPQIAKHVEQPCGVARREGRRGLVEDQQPRVHREGAGNGDELLLCRRQVTQGRVRPKLHPDARQRARGIGVHLPAIEESQRAAARRLASEEHVARDVQRVDQLALLVDDPDAEPGGIDRSVHFDRCTVDANLARVGTMDPGQDLYQSRLAGAVLADQRRRSRRPQARNPHRRARRHREIALRSPTFAVKERASMVTSGAPAWEQRWHPLREEWVVVAAHRQDRPWQGERATVSPPPAPEYVEELLFLPAEPARGRRAEPRLPVGLRLRQ